MSCFMRLVLIIGICILSLDIQAKDKKDVVEEKKAPKKEYKNPFESLQKQRAVNQAKQAKAILKATPKPGTKTKRDPRKSKKAIMYGKKVSSINGKIQKKYISLVSGYARIPRLKKKIDAWNERLKMTSSTEGTMAQISKAEAALLELKEEFQARVVAFEPVPRNLLEGDSFKNNPKFTWLKEFAPQE